MGHVHEFGVLVACEKRNTKCTRTCACAQTLRSHCYSRAQGDNFSHKKQRFSKKWVTWKAIWLLVRKFFKITDDYLLGKSHSNFESIGLRSPFIHSVLHLRSLYNISSCSNQSSWLFHFNCDVAGRVLCLFLVLPCVGLQSVIVAFPDHLLEPGSFFVARIPQFF